MATPPPWSRDETVLALWAATIRGQQVAIDDPEVVELSALMRSAAPANLSDSERFRNPHGVARKIWGFLDRLEGGTDGLLSSVAESVWQQFAGDRRRLAAEATSARRRLAAAAQRPDAPSRGPVPASFSNLVCGDDGPAWLYVAALGGVVLESGEIFVKVGRTNDIRRRENDLNFALPRRLGLRWRMVASWRLPSPVLAHLAEQTVLQSEAVAGRSAGGEFLLIRTEGVGRLLRRCRRVVRLSRNGAARTSPRSIDNGALTPRRQRGRNLWESRIDGGETLVH